MLTLLLSPLGSHNAGAAQPEVRFESLRIDSSAGTSGSEFAWPADTHLSAAAVIKLSGYTRPGKALLFTVLTDSRGTVLFKDKQKLTAEEGTLEATIPDILDLSRQYGRRSFRLTSEFSAPGVDKLTRSVEFMVTGPKAPEITVHQLEVYSPVSGKGTVSFGPGDTFVAEAIIEVAANDSKAEPTIRVLATMDEDDRVVDPSAERQSYIDYWDIRRLGATEGLFRLRATGLLPVFYSEPWESEHRFKVEVRLELDPQTYASKVAPGRIIDFHYGDMRRNDDIVERLIEVNRGYTWELKPLAQALADDAAER